MSDNKKIVKQLIDNNDIKSFDDFSSIMEQLQGELLQTLLEGELDCHLGYDKGSHDNKSDDNRRNGYCKEKKVKTKNGTFSVKTPRDRNGSFNPTIIPKKQTMLDSFEDIAISCYAKGMSLRDIEKLFQDIYHAKFNKEQISYLISKVNDEVKEWQNRPLKELYAFVYVDCLYVPIKKDLISEKCAVYVMIGIDITGHKEIIGIWIGESESATFWTNILEEIKTRGVKDILFISLDGLTGLTEAIEKIFPHTIVQRCIVHLSRNLYMICPKKQAANIMSDFKKIYQSQTKEEAELRYEEFCEKYKDNQKIVNKVTNAMPYIYQIMDYPKEIRKVIYTTNPIESVNSALRKVTRGKGALPSEESVMKLLYLRIKELEKKWTKSIPNWSIIINQLSLLFHNRIVDYL